MAPTCSRERSSNDLSIPPKLSGHTPDGPKQTLHRLYK